MKRKRVIGLLLTMLLLTASLSMAEDVLSMPDSLQVIDQEAFYGSTDISKVTLPDGVLEIRSKAFANSAVTYINLPDSLTFIADDAFDRADNVTVSVGMDSYAHEWAKNNLKGSNQHILTSEIVTVNETIPRTTETIWSNYINFDYIKEEGSDGTREVTYQISYKDGIEIERSEISSKIIVEMVPRVEEKTTWTTTYENITIDYDSSGAHRNDIVEAEAQEWALAMAKGETKYGHTYKSRGESIVTCDKLEDVASTLKKHSDVSIQGEEYGIGVVRVQQFDEDGILMFEYFIGAGISYSPYEMEYYLGVRP